MKIAVMSDIHSNCSAFLACLEDARTQGADGFVFLGDYVSDLANPRETMDLVYETQANHPTLCLRGNREDYLLDWERGNTSFVPGSKSGSLLYTGEQLRQKDFDFFRSLKISDSVSLGTVQIEIAHAAMGNDRFYFDGDDGRITEIFSQMKERILLTGHSHKQYIRKSAGKMIINPGSVGIPQGGSRWPKYAMLEIAMGDVSCVFREVPYDMTRTIHAQFASGLVGRANFWAIGILYDIITGDEWVLKLLQAAREMGDVRDEEVWHAAAAQLGMRRTEQEILAVYRELCGGKVGESVW